MITVTQHPSVCLCCQDFSQEATTDAIVGTIISELFNVTVLKISQKEISANEYITNSNYKLKTIYGSTENLQDTTDQLVNASRPPFYRNGPVHRSFNPSLYTPVLTPQLWTGSFTLEWLQIVSTQHKIKNSPTSKQGGKLGESRREKEIGRIVRRRHRSWSKCSGKGLTSPGSLSVLIFMLTC